LGGCPAKAEKGRREKENNAKAQSRREENEKDSVVACRGMGILPMDVHGRDARATWGMAFFAVKGTGRVRRGRGSPSISPAERGAGRDAGDTCALCVLCALCGFTLSRR